MCRTDRSERAARADVGGKRRHRGHSLLEAMLAGSVLLAGLYGMVGALGNNTRVAAHTVRMTTAVNLNEKTLERLLLLPSGHADLGAGTHYGATYNMDGAPEPGGPFAPEWTISSGPIDGSLDIVARVRWTENGQARSSSLRTLR